MSGPAQTPLSQVAEQFSRTLDWIVEHNHQLTGIPLRLVRGGLILTLPFFIGAFGEFVVTSWIANGYSPILVIVENRLEFTVVVILMTLYSLMLFWHQRASHVYRYTDRIHDALKWMYEDLDLGLDKQADIRCTISWRFK